MNELAFQILPRIGAASAFLALSAVVAATLLTWFRCQSPAIHRAAWSLVLVQGVLFVQLPISIPWQSDPAQGTIINGVSASAPTEMAEFGVGVASPLSDKVALTPGVGVHLAESSIAKNWGALLMLAWAGGVFLLLSGWGMRYLRFVRSSTCEECDVESWCREWEEVVKDCNVRHLLKLYVSENVGPLLCRWPFDYRVIVPHSLWRKLTSQQRKGILRHELAHFERFDLGKMLFANMLALLHWFNPLAWLAARRLEESIEWTCDDIVEAGSPNGATHYARALLSIGEHNLHRAAWASAIFGGGLSGRIRRLLLTERRPDSRRSAWLPIGMLVGLLLVNVIRVDLVAQETDQFVDDNRSDGSVSTETYFVAPITTEFQRWRVGGDQVVAYASIDGMSFMAPETGAIDPEQFDFQSLQSSLNNVREKSDPGTLKVEIDFGVITHRPAVNRFLEAALARMGTDAGFKNVEFIKKYSYEEVHQWPGLPRANGTRHDEPQLGSDTVLVFPVRTPLGKYLAGDYFAGGVDCYIKIPGPLSLEAPQILSEADKATIRNELQEMQVPADASVIIHVALETPEDRDTVRDLPQVKKGAEFHRDAVEYLKSSGFAEVVVAVEVPSSVLHKSSYN